jgi:hypothetical protein
VIKSVLPQLKAKITDQSPASPPCVSMAQPCPSQSSRAIAISRGQPTIVA